MRNFNGIVAILVTVSCLCGQDALTNEAVLKLTKAGLART